VTVKYKCYYTAWYSPQRSDRSFVTTKPNSGQGQITGT